MPDELGTPIGPPPGQADANAGGHGRSPDEIALDLMKFIAATTGYGKSGGSTAGFSGKPTARSAEEHAESLIQLFERCRGVVKGK